MLMDSRLHSEFTGAKANIARRVGGRFTAYDGWAEGRNLELVKDKKIVQRWRGADWLAGHYSTVTYRLSGSGNGTRLEFVQTGVPVEVYKDISAGWKEHYWNKMKLALR
jgi:activator of HSP90 ATPase